MGRSRSRRSAKTRRGTKPFRVKPHSRSPRGINTGKTRPKVRSYRRGKPDPSSYPRARAFGGPRRRKRKSR